MSCTPWVEKYRPKTLKDIVGNEETIKRFIQLSKQGNVTNLVISVGQAQRVRAYDQVNSLQGPPGCGKTTSVWALARDMLGAGEVKEACLELNASGREVCSQNNEKACLGLSLS